MRPDLFQKLIDEIALDTLARGYSTMGDSDVLHSLLNTKDREIPHVVQRSDVIGYLVIERKYLAVKESQSSSAKEFLAAINDLGSFDLTKQGLTNSALSTVNALLDEMIVEGLISLADKNVLVSMSTTQVSRAEELGLGSIKEGDVAAAAGS